MDADPEGGTFLKYLPWSLPGDFGALESQRQNRDEGNETLNEPVKWQDLNFEMIKRLCQPSLKK